MKKGLVILLVLLLVIYAPTNSVYALEPPESIVISPVIVARNTVETGDFAFIFYFNTVYDDYPEDVTASQAVIIRLFDTNGETLMATTNPYSLSLLDYGYGPQVKGIYFSANASATLELAAYAPYVLSIAYSEAYLGGVPPYNYALVPSDYTGVEGQTANRELLAAWIFGACTLMEAARPNYLLQGTTDIGMALTSFGETYFRGAIPGLQSICPDVFFYQYYMPQITEIDYSTALAKSYGEEFESSDIGIGLEGIGDWLGISGSFVAALIFIVLALAIMIFTAWRGWGIEPGLEAGGALMIMGALIAGNATLILTIVMALLCVIMLLYVILFAKA